MKRFGILVCCLILITLCVLQDEELLGKSVEAVEPSATLASGEYVGHDPILIENSTSSAEFVELGCSGNGTRDAPFVIEGFSINCAGVEPAIEIRNPEAGRAVSSKYFVIRYCYLYNSTSDTTGIYIPDATVGRIEHNIIDTHSGIHVISANVIGLSHDFEITSNHLTNDGPVSLSVDVARGFTIEYNVASENLLVDRPRNSTISNNQFSEMSISDIEWDDSPKGNVIFNNTVERLYVDDHSFLVLENNTVTNRLRIRDCDNTTMFGNDILGRALLGYESGGHHYPLRNFTAMWNVFDDDVYQEWGYPRPENCFDYNWYYDYIGTDMDENNIGDSPYVQDTSKLGSGYEAVIDNHPLIELRGFVAIHESISPSIDHPDDIQYDEFSKDNFIVWNASDDHPSQYYVYRNGSIYASGEWTGSAIEVDIDGLEIGVHNLTVLVEDILGNSATDTVFVTVVDGTPPVLNSPNDVLLQEGATDYSVTWSPSDYHPESYQITRNGTIIASGSWNSTDESISISLSDFAAGTYNLTLVVTDLGGNSISDSVVVTILPESTHPTDFIIHPIIMYALGLGFGILGVVILLAFLKRR